MRRPFCPLAKPGDLLGHQFGERHQFTDASGVERVFIEGRLRAGNIRTSILSPGEKPGRQDEDNHRERAIDFTLNDFVEQFPIPDDARVNPTGYQRSLDREVWLVLHTPSPGNSFAFHTEGLA